jgi:hypothetical protein
VLVFRRVRSAFRGGRTARSIGRARLRLGRRGSASTIALSPMQGHARSGPGRCYCQCDTRVSVRIRRRGNHLQDRGAFRPR